MKPIGFYRWVWAGGTDPQYARKPFYDRRTVGLLSTRQDVTQILIQNLGAWVWINVNPSDLEPTC